MAYITQEEKKVVRENLKPILEKYNLKGTLSIGNHSTLILTINSGEIDFIKNYCEVIEKESWKERSQEEFERKINYIKEKKNISVNRYYIDDYWTDKAKECIREIDKAMMSADWYDNSDAMTDYFDTAYYIDINIGRWNKPYQLLEKTN